MQKIYLLIQGLPLKSTLQNVNMSFFKRQYFENMLCLLILELKFVKNTQKKIQGVPFKVSKFV